MAVVTNYSTVSKQLLAAYWCLSLWISVSILCLHQISYVASSSVSFSLTYRDAERSVLRTAEADPADLPEGMPMRTHVAAGRALRGRLHKKLSSKPLMGKLSYKGDMVGEVYLTVPVGTPSQNLIFLIDTGSELTWAECSPCLNCTSTKAQPFAFNQSSSFLGIGCFSPLCRDSVGLRRVTDQCDGGLCSFEVSYVDGSFDMGFLSVDYFDLGGQFSKQFVMGCAIVVRDSVPDTPYSGIMGLDAGPFSFTTQVFAGMKADVPRKFAYCLPDRFKSLNALGRIEFGIYTLREKLRYTPLAPPYSPLGSVFYFVELKGISVGKSLISVDMQGAVTGGGTLFDSGAEATVLVKPLYDLVVAEMRRQTVQLGPFNASETVLQSDLCYKVAGNAKRPPKVPRISLHFAGGVDLDLGPGSTLAAGLLGGNDTNIYFCFAFFSTLDNLNTIGNYQQQNYWVEFNLQTSSLGLAKADCANF